MLISTLVNFTFHIEKNNIFSSASALQKCTRWINRVYLLNSVFYLNRTAQLRREGIKESSMFNGHLGKPFLKEKIASLAVVVQKTGSEKLGNSLRIDHFK